MTVVAAMGQMFYSLSIVESIVFNRFLYETRRVHQKNLLQMWDFLTSTIAIMAGLMIIQQSLHFPVEIRMPAGWSGADVHYHPKVLPT